MMSEAATTEQKDTKQSHPKFNVGDTIEVHVRVIEGDKERTQIFKGVVIKKRGSIETGTFTVRKISEGIGVERIFPLVTPMIAKIKIVSRGKVRRAKLYYLRNLTGKAARIKEKRTT